MKRFDDKKKREVFCTFYQDCLSKHIDPFKSEADRQRTILLAQNNPSMVEALGDDLADKCLDAFLMGKECSEERDDAKKWADEEAELSKNRTIDEKAAALEVALSKRQGREKRMFFLEKTIEYWQGEVQTFRGIMDSSVRSRLSAVQSVEQSESSWGTLGGIAAGITGSSAVGAAVAADTMKKNAETHANNSVVLQSVLPIYQTQFEMALSAAGDAEEIQKKFQKQAEKIKLHLVENQSAEDLMKGLVLSKPEIAFTSGHTMLIRMNVTPKRDYQMAGNVPAVVDGCFRADVYQENTKIGCAYLNFPRDGASKTVTLKGHCLEAQAGGNYTITIVPTGLWLIEKYTSTPVLQYINDKRVEHTVCDLDTLIPSYKIPWNSISIENSAWNKKLARQMEQIAKGREVAERKAAEEKAAAAEQAKKAKKIAMIAAPIVVVAIVAAVLISNFVKAQQEEAARLDAYNAAVALAEAGQYEEAIAAFTELGNYKDSAELVAQAQEDAEEAARFDAYNAAVALAEAGRYDKAIAAFEELGDYKDCRERISSAELEKKYIEALTLLENRDFNAARAAFDALGDYKDAKTYLDGFVIRLTSWTYDGKESGEYQYNKSGDVIKSGNWTYEYSADKRTITRSAKSISITETYDEQGHLAQESEQSYAGSATSAFTYEFNSDGTVSTRIEKRTEHNGFITHERDCVVSYEYGDNGLVSKETETETSAYNLREGKGPDSITVREYYYDDDGQMLSRTDTVTSYNPTTGEAREYHHKWEYTSGWVYAPNAEE